MTCDKPKTNPIPIKTKPSPIQTGLPQIKLHRNLPPPPPNKSQQSLSLVWLDDLDPVTTIPFILLNGRIRKAYK